MMLDLFSYDVLYHSGALSNQVCDTWMDFFEDANEIKLVITVRHGVDAQFVQKDRSFWQSQIGRIL